MVKNKMLSVCGSKKGNALLDGLTIIVALVFLAIVVMGGNYVADLTNTEVQNDNSIDGETKDHYNTVVNNYSDFWDNAFIFCLVFFWLGALVASFFIDTHPIFLVITIAGMILLVGVVMMLGNGVEELMQDNFFKQFEDDYPKMVFIMQHLAETFTIIFATIGVALYAKHN